MTSKGYNKDRHSSLPYVDKQYKQLLDKLAEKTGRSKKRAVEMAIVDHCIVNGVNGEKTK